MADAAKQKKIESTVRRISADPALLDELLSASKGQRKQKLEDLGLGDVNRRDVSEHFKKLMIADPGAEPSADRPVEWVGALATLAAGALAI